MKKLTILCLILLLCVQLHPDLVAAAELELPESDTLDSIISESDTVELAPTEGPDITEIPTNPYAESTLLTLLDIYSLLNLTFDYLMQSWNLIIFFIIAAFTWWFSSTCFRFRR